MRLLLDESVSRRLARSLPNHDVRTVVDMGWAGTRNGELLLRASSEFDALVTVDKNMAYQQNLASLPLAVVLLDASSIELRALLPLVPALEVALTSLVPCSFVKVGE